MSLEYKDMLGYPINVGDYITYAALWDRSAMLKIGQVIELSKREVYDYSADNRKKDIPTIKVRGVERSWRPGELRPNSKIVSLAFLDRMLVVPAESVPDDWKQALAKVGNEA